MPNIILGFCFTCSPEHDPSPGTAFVEGAGLGVFLGD